MIRGKPGKRPKDVVSTTVRGIHKVKKKWGREGLSRSLVEKKPACAWTNQMHTKTTTYEEKKRNKPTCVRVANCEKVENRGKGGGQEEGTGIR